jgi:hypothetical protein
LGVVCMNTHDLAGAAECFEQSRVLREAIGDRAGEASMQRRLAALRHQNGDHDAPLHHRA